MKTLNIQVLGNFHLKYNDQTITQINTPKLQSVLAYLILHYHAPQSRYQAAAALWPTSSDAQARTNLRKYIHQLRDVLPDTERFLQINSNSIYWRQDAALHLDVKEFEKAVADALEADKNHDPQRHKQALINAVHRYHGDLVPDCYDEWITQPRDRLSQMYVKALSKLSMLLEKQRDYSTAIHYLQQLLSYDPLSEITYQHLMRLYALIGDRGKAQQTFEQCRRVMEDELGISPGQATLDIFKRLTMPNGTAKGVHRPISTEYEHALVGKHVEWEQLHAVWMRVTEGKPQFVLISGVAGIGKTKLAGEFVNWVKKQGYATASAQTYAVEKPLAYAPVITWMRSGVMKDAISRIDKMWIRELARLLPELLTMYPNLPPPEPLSEDWQRQRLFEAITQVVLNVPAPLLLFIDDLQWCDQQTLDWLHYLLRLESQSKILVLGTLRPESAVIEPQLVGLLNELYRRHQMTELMLNPLNRTETGILADHATVRKLTLEEQERLYQETEGHPLFIIEILRASPSLSQMPQSVKAVIERRLNQLSPDARSLVELASVIGREFTFSIAAQASQQDGEALVFALDELLQRHLIREQDDDRYDFTHDKIREVAYRSPSRTRRKFLHHRVARVLEAAANTSELAGEIAYHYTESGKTEKAVQYRLDAGKHALALAAYREASGQLQQGLDLLRTMPHTPERDQNELEFLMALGTSTVPLKGFIAPEVHQIYDDAVCLLTKLPQSAELVPLIYSLGQFYILQGKWKTGFAFGEQCLSLALTANDPSALMLAHTLLGCASCYMGNLSSALDHLRSSLSYSNNGSNLNSNLDNRVWCNSFMSLALWILGYAEQAHTCIQIAVSLARAREAPHSLAIALTYAAQISLLKREPVITQNISSESILLCTKYELFHWLNVSNVIHGWALAQQGQVGNGIQQIRSGITGLASLVQLDAYAYPILAEAYVMAADFERCHDALHHGLIQASLTDIRCFESMTLRIKGDLLLQSGAEFQEVEAAYRQAIEFAQAQEAKSFELQATISLSRLYQQQGKITEARQMLTEIYNWFTEGFDTPDFRDARALLDELR